MAPKIKLTYFDGKGRAEPIRLAFIVGGIEFEDERIPPSEFMERKTSGKLTFGSLPVLEIDDEMFGESGALLRYAANIAGLTPTCPVNACKVDMVIDALESIALALFNDKSVEARTKVVKNDIPRYLAPIESAIAKSDGPFLLGEKISAADIKLAVVVGMLKGGIMDHIPVDCVDKYAAVMDTYTAVMEHERINKYYASQ